MQNWLGKHPAFREGFPAEHNLLYTEMQAMEAFGIDDEVYFAKPREARMAMVAYVISRNALKAMQEYDMAKKAEDKMKRKGKK